MHDKFVWVSTHEQGVAACCVSLKSVEQFTRKRAQKFLISHTTLTLHADQGHPDWHQNVEFSCIYHYTKFERIRSINGRMHANVKEVFFWRNCISKVLSLNIETIWTWPSSDQQISTVHQIPSKSIQSFLISLAQVFLLSRPHMTCNQGHSHKDRNGHVQFNNVCHHTKFEPNRFLNDRMLASIFFFFFFFFWGGEGGGEWHGQLNSIYFPWFNKSHKNISTRTFNINWFNATSNVMPICWKSMRENEAKPNEARFCFPLTIWPPWRSRSKVPMIVAATNKKTVEKFAHDVECQRLCYARQTAGQPAGRI